MQSELMLPTLTFPGNAVFFTYYWQRISLHWLTTETISHAIHLGIVGRASCLYRFSLRPDSVTLGSALVDYTKELQHVQNDTFQLPDQNVH